MLSTDFAKESLTATEASSHAHTENHPDELENVHDDLQLRKGENRIKYRKLKQKLSNLCSSHDDQQAGAKEISSKNKHRIMKLAAELERMVKTAERDYEGLENLGREFSKIMIENKQDMHTIRQCKIVPIYFELFQKIPSMHKKELDLAIKALELGLRNISTFASAALNRDYLIATVRLKEIFQLIHCLLGRLEKKSSMNPSLYPLLNISFKIINQLIQHKPADTAAVTIVNIVIQLFECSKTIRKIKTVLFEQLLIDGFILEADLALEMLKFLNLIAKKSIITMTPIVPFCELEELSPTPKYYCGRNLVDYLTPMMMCYVLLINSVENTVNDPNYNYSMTILSIFSLCIKTINYCFQICHSTCKRIIEELKVAESNRMSEFRIIELGLSRKYINENILNDFIATITCLISHCREMFDECGGQQIRQLLNELIVLVGHLAVDDCGSQKKLNECGVLEELGKLPLPFMMEMSLREIVIPTFCCLIHGYRPNMIALLRERSPQDIIKFLKKEIQAATTISRKNSAMSMIALETDFDLLNVNALSDHYELNLRFPFVYWQDLVDELEKHL